MQYDSAEIKNFEKEYKNKNLKTEIPCYTKAQMKKRYPDNQFKVIGEIHSEKASILQTDNSVMVKGKEIPVFRKNTHRAFQRVTGYLQCTDGSYIALLSSYLVQVVILAVLCVGLCVGGGWMLYSTLQTAPVDHSTADRVELELDENAKDWEGETPAAQSTGETADKGIAIPGYPEIYIPAGEKEVQLALLNPEGNPCYFTFEVVLDDTGETLFQSKMVPPGKVLNIVELSKALDVGEYQATIKIRTFELETLSVLNGANMKTTLIVK